MVSSLIPRNSMDVAGPSVFSSARGTPRVAKAVFRQDRLCAGGEEGGSTVRKSSNRWTRNGMR